jgi:hypothetical protein
VVSYINECFITLAFVDFLSAEPPNGIMESKAVISARRLYNSCIDEHAIENEGVDAILSLINGEFGGWPILQGSTWNESSFNFSEVWFKLSQHATFAFYEVVTKMDLVNTSTYSIRVSR